MYRNKTRQVMVAMSQSVVTPYFHSVYDKYQNAGCSRNGKADQ